MASIFITGSSDGLGLLSAKKLVSLGHKVVLHARNAERGKEALKKVPGAAAVLTGDLTRIEEIRLLADAVNAAGSFDAVIHNAGIYKAMARDLFMVNTLAPYLLTCLIQRPARLIYISSGMHLQGRLLPGQFVADIGRITYSDTKLHVLMLSKAVARKWTDVYSNAVDPGWVPTKMGGRGAPDDLEQGYETQVWLAAGEAAAAHVSGRYFFHQREAHYHPAADDITLQERLLTQCREYSGISMP